MGAESAVAMGGLQMLQAKQQADAIEAESRFNSSQMLHNARLLEFEKHDIAKQAKAVKHLREKQVNQMIGAQRVSLAAQGIDIDSELGMVLEDQEREMGYQDVLAIKNNAWRETMGLEIKQHDLRTSAAMGRITGKSAASATKAQGFLSGISKGASAFGTAKEITGKSSLDYSGLTDVSLF